MKKSNNDKSRRKSERRKSLKVLGAGAITAGASEPWVRPVMQAIVLPAHADTSTFRATCEINFSREMHATGNPQLTQVLKTGTFQGDLDIAGVYTGVMPGAATITGDCTETAIGFEELPLTITVERL